MYDMLAARRRIIMAKKKPSFHVWDGTRDYSFFSTGASTWYIDTPEKWAALCMISLGMDVADGSGLSSAKYTMGSKNIEVTEDLYFNEGYKDNFSWETTYQNDSEKDILNNFAYVLRADGQRVALYLEAYCNGFNGNFHKIVGMYASSYTKYHPGIITDPATNVVNISFEYCTLKNGMTRETPDSNYFPSLIYDDDNSATYKNIRAYHCKTIGVCTDNYIGRGFLIGSRCWYPPSSAIMQNLSVQSCQAMLIYSEYAFNTYYNRYQHAFVHNDSQNKHYKFIHTFENENLVPNQALRNTYQVSVPYQYGNDPKTPASESFVYTFGNIGTTTTHETSILQTMSSKAALIAQVNADITANASGDLSLLDENGNFTGVCP